MASRLKLQTVLETLLGSENVYYQPPESMFIKYPAIIYSRYKIENKFANNKVYRQLHPYLITVIDEDPDSEIVEKISQLSTCRFDRHYVSDNLNHDTFILYF